MACNIIHLMFTLKLISNFCYFIRKAKLTFTVNEIWKLTDNNKIRKIYLWVEKVVPLMSIRCIFVSPTDGATCAVRRTDGEPDDRGCG